MIIPLNSREVQLRHIQKASCFSKYLCFLYNTGGPAAVMCRTSRVSLALILNKLYQFAVESFALVIEQEMATVLKCNKPGIYYTVPLCNCQLI